MNFTKLQVGSLAVVLLCGCDVRVSNPPAEKTVEKKETTIVNPPAVKEEKKVENNTTIVNPPGK